MLDEKRVFKCIRMFAVEDRILSDGVKNDDGNLLMSW
jgi:hypothetical protein